MDPMKRASSHPPGPARDLEAELGVSAPYVLAWRALTPAQRLRRAWRLRSRLKNPAAIHDAKTFPEL